MADYFHQKPADVTTRRRRGFIGQVSAGAGIRQYDAINASGTAAHIVDLTISSYAGSETYSFTFTRDGQTINYSYVAASGENSAALVSAAIVDDILNTAGDLLDYVYPSVSSSKVRLISNDSGAASAFTLSSLSSNLSQSTVQSGADATAISFGRGVIRGTKPTSASVFEAAQTQSAFNSFMVLPSSSTLPPMTRTFVAAGTYTSGDIFHLSGVIRWGDQQIPIAFPFGIGQTAVDAAFADAVTLLNTNFGSYLTAAYTNSSNTLVVTSDYNGLYIDINITAPGSNTITKTSANDTKVAQDLFLGCTAYRFVNGTTELGTFNTTIPANDSGVYLRGGGSVWVDYAGTAPADGDLVYLCTDTGEVGKFSATAGSHRVPLPRGVARWGGSDGDTALLHLSGI